MTHSIKSLKGKIKTLIKEELSKSASAVFKAAYELAQGDLDQGTWGNMAEKFGGLKQKPRSRNEVLDFERGYIEAMRDNINTLRQKVEALEQELELEATKFENDVLESKYPEKPKNIW